MKSETYNFLQKIVNGDEIDHWNYPDPLIYDVKDDGTVIIAFDKADDFLDVFDIPDEDRDTWSVYVGGAYDGRDYDYDQYYQDWSEGHISPTFNNENEELLNDIIKYVKPELSPITDDNRSEVNELLRDMFKSEIEDIIDEYTVMYDNCISVSVKKELNSYLLDPFSRFGITEVYEHYKFKTTAKILLKIFRILKDDTLTLKELLTELNEKYIKVDTGRNYWYELPDNVGCGGDDFDDNYFQDIVNTNLNKILDSIHENPEISEKYEDYIKMINVINKHGGFNKNIGIPNKGDVIFTDSDFETTTINYKFYKPDHSVERRSVNNLDDLNLLFSNLELFEEVTRFKKLIS
jgi:nicotinamide riboside kinase